MLWRDINLIFESILRRLLAGVVLVDVDVAEQGGDSTERWRLSSSISSV